ncbi:hypothetical protein VTK73DRAFT_9431 [Phialemonium thermophilum]|uniref:non-specific serine/threonine protein kinase n=1 Tax=Phialemonium thermophilum TaxID=223376 RepID=A0ABR3W254_9PEZI
MAQVFFDMLYSFGSCFNCLPGSPTVKVNNRNLKILRLLGEGGFSYVYLVQDTATSELFALKKIRCPFGAESVAQAMKEVEAYKLFARAPGIIHSIDYSIATERGSPAGGNLGDAGGAGPAKTVYILLPYYRRGNLQDAINANLVNHTRFPERHLMLLFLGVCRALRHMHKYDPADAAERMELPASASASQHVGDGADENVEVAKGRKARRTRRADVEDETEQQRPLMEGEDRGPGAGEGRSYAHRDIKPGNIMISDSGSDPILMDLGSVAPSPLAITSRAQAIAAQDAAAEHSTMPYRAPELFDVKTGAVLDGRADVWSLGCTLFACLVGRSPFEMRSDETGGSLSLCVLGGDWRFPDEKPGGGAAKKKNVAAAAEGAAAADGEYRISEPVREVVRRCLRVEPSERPDIDELIDMVERVIEELPEDDAP